MTDPPKISVVIPCFNMGEFVGEAAGSVFAQRRDDVEIIVVDDGSNDGATPATLDALRGPSKIRLIRTTNNGLASARNAGIRDSRGEFIAFLDADDRFATGAFDTMADALVTHPEAAYVYGHTRAFGARNEIWYRGQFNFFHEIFGNEFEPAVMIRRSAIERVGGFRSVGPVPGVEDWDLWLRLGSNGLFGHRVDAVTLEYRIRPGSMVAAIKARWDETVAAIRAANADLFAPEKLLEIKRQWSPGISVILPGNDVPLSSIDSLGEFCRDFEIRTLDGERLMPDGPTGLKNAGPLSANVIRLDLFAIDSIRLAFDRVREDELKWPLSSLPHTGQKESAKRHSTPIWWNADPPRDADELDGPLARFRLFQCRLRSNRETTWAGFGAGLFARRLLRRLDVGEKPVAVFDDNPATDEIEGVPVMRPGEPPRVERILVLSDLYDRALFQRAIGLWPTLSNRIHALDF